MKNIISWIMTIGVLALSSAAQAAVFEPEALVKVKPGTCTLLVFQPDGLNAMPAEDIIIMDAETAMIEHHGLTDASGMFVVELDTGRYILAASGVKMAIIDVSESYELNTLRLILPEESLQVGGAEGDTPGTGKDAADIPEEEKSDRKGGWITTGGGAATAGAAAGAAVGGSIIIEKQNDDGSGAPPPEEEEEPNPTPPSNPEPEEEPEDPPGPSEPVVVVDPCSMYRLQGGLLVNPCFPL